MKKLIYALSIAFLIISCNDGPKDYVTLSGKITDKISDSLSIDSNDYHKKINVNSDGTFSDTLKIENRRFVLFDGKRSIFVYLENGYDLNISFNARNVSEPPIFKGSGADINNYYLEKMIFETEIIKNSAMFDLNKKEFNQKIKEIDSGYRLLLDKIKNADSTLIIFENRNIESQKTYLLKKHEDKQYIKAFLDKGMPSPKFVDYENFNGKNTSLDDLKGKYVYIGFWSTNLNFIHKLETPYLQLLEDKYLGKNIVFVSICIDRQINYDIWKQTIVDEKFGGIQLFSKGDESFRDAYRGMGTNRFILIDPNGNIVSADAPRPSSKDLIVLFDELKL